MLSEGSEAPLLSFFLAASRAFLSSSLGVGNVDGLNFLAFLPACSRYKSTDWDWIASKMCLLCQLRTPQPMFSVPPASDARSAESSGSHFERTRTSPGVHSPSASRRDLMTFRSKCGSW